MSRFRKLIENEGFNFDDSKSTETEGGTFKVKFHEVLDAAFRDILEEKSEIYRDMVNKGVGVDFTNAFTFPDQTKSDVHELIANYKEDMK